MNQRLLALKPYPMGLLAAAKTRILEAGGKVFDFGTGDPIEPTAPLIREAFRSGLPAVSQYPSVRGGAKLRRVFAEWFARRFEVRLDPDSEVLPTQGSKEAIFHLPMVLVEPKAPKHAVAYPEPGYPVYEIGTLFADAEPIAIRLTAENGFLMDPDRIGDEVLARCALVWLCYPHNPSGADLPGSLWRRWARARERHDFVLLSDECYTELYFGERPRSLLQYGRKNCLVFHSLSKRSGMTGYRSGIVAGDPELVAFYARFRLGMGVALPAPTEAASIAAWSDEQHVVERRAVFARKRELFLRFFQEHGLEVFPNTSTFYLWVRAPQGSDGERYAARLMEHGIIVSPGAYFGAGNEGWFRVALVPDVQSCGEAIETWSKL